MKDINSDKLAAMFASGDIEMMAVAANIMSHLSSNEVLYIFNSKTNDKFSHVVPTVHYSQDEWTFGVEKTGSPVLGILYPDFVCVCLEYKIWLSTHKAWGEIDAAHRNRKDRLKIISNEYQTVLEGLL